MTAQQINKAKQAIEQIFQNLNIKQFIYVDDVFAFKDLHDVEKVIGLFAEAVKLRSVEAVKLIEKLLDLENLGSDVNGEIWKRRVGDNWKQYSESEQTEILEQLKSFLNSQLSADTLVTSQIKQVLPETVTYLELSPSNWQNQKAKILESTSEDFYALCLFDQDLKYDPGFTTSGSFSGGGLLKELVESEYGVFTICGILSHRIVSTEQEIEFRNGFASEYGVTDLDTNKYLPLSKSRLQDPTFSKFADGIKKLTLNKFAEELKDEAIGILDTAHQEARDMLVALDVYALDLMVFTASRKSGVGAWEAETIVRIFQIFQRDNMRKLLFDSKVAAKFNSLIKSSRLISEIDILQEDDVYPRVRKYRRQELYEPNVLTKHSPLQVGDIFSRLHDDGSKQDYILLAQPCDLAVRANGNRAREIVSLVPITQEDNSRKSRRNSKAFWNDYWSTRAIIDNFFQDAEKIGVLEFKEAKWVHIDLLDLSVLNPNGDCSIDLNKKIDPPPQLTHGWLTLLENLIERFRNQKERLDKLLQDIDVIRDESTRIILWNTMMPKLTFSKFLPSEPYSDGVFDFKLRRIERYRQPGADSLLKSYMHYMARDAKDFDFTKKK